MSMLAPPLKFTLFPYTTLFRSANRRSNTSPTRRAEKWCAAPPARFSLRPSSASKLSPISGSGADERDDRRRGRSEEHTSELQSPCNLVCRLLLEKKKTY